MIRQTRAKNYGFQQRKDREIRTILAAIEENRHNREHLQHQYMSRIAKLRNNFRLLFWGRALVELKTLNAIVTLFYLSRGVSIEEVFYLGIIWSIANVVFEIPTGYLADRIGRKATMLLGAAIYVIQQIGYFYANSFFDFAIILIIMAAGWTCFSGTEEALMYDSLEELGETKRTTAQNGKLQAARHVFKLFFPLLGTLIASAMLPWQIAIILSIDTIAAIAALAIYTRLTEPEHKDKMLQKEKRILRDSITTIWKDPFLFRASANKLLPFIGSIIMWRAYQPILSDHGVSIVWLGIFYFLLQSIAFLGKWFSGKLEDRFGVTRLLSITGALIIVSLGIFLASNNAVVLFIAILFALVVESARQPLFAHAMNTRIKSHARATTLSNLNFIKAFFEIPIYLITGMVTMHYGLQNTMIIPIILCLMAMLIFPIKKSDMLNVAPKRM